ncbi:Glutathione S-transferase P [Balamuthia mandrillaris]
MEGKAAGEKSDLSVQLRYFACRGRGQGLRYILVDAGHPFEEAVVSALGETWKAKKEAQSFSGPFGSLPVLQWGDYTVAQTEAIAHYLGQKLNYYGSDTSPEQTCKAGMLVSAAYQDLIQPFLALFWSPIRAKGSDTKDLLSQFYNVKVKDLLPRFQALLGDKPFFIDEERPTIADFFVFEALDLLGTCLGHDNLFHSDKEEGLQKLREFHGRMLKRPNIALYFGGKGPCPPFFRPITLSPAEEEVQHVMDAFALELEAARSS